MTDYVKEQLEIKANEYIKNLSPTINSLTAYQCYKDGYEAGHDDIEDMFERLVKINLDLRCDNAELKTKINQQKNDFNKLLDLLPLRAMQKAKRFETIERLKFFLNTKSEYKINLVLGAKNKILIQKALAEIESERKIQNEQIETLLKLTFEEFNNWHKETLGTLYLDAQGESQQAQEFYEVLKFFEYKINNLPK